MEGLGIYNLVRRTTVLWLLTTVFVSSRLRPMIAYDTCKVRMTSVAFMPLKVDQNKQMYI